MKFKGDIIITDPCYIIKESNPDDWDKCDFGDNMEILGIKHYISEYTIYGDWSCTTFNVGDRDPKDFIKEYSKITDRMLALDDCCEEAEILSFKIDNLKKLGRFCADAGKVAVFYLKDVLKYNPEFDFHITRPWTTTVIRDFNGDIEYYLDENTDAHIIGKGNINFATLQTGL